MLKFAIIGSGYIGKRHADMILHNPGALLEAMCDIRSRLDTGVREEVPFYSSPELMLEKHPDVDVAVVCSPNGFHAEHALLALNAGKHVVLEKPMALTKADCEKIIYTALRNSKQVFCVMQNRYSPPSEWLKGIVEKGILGKIYLVQINCFWNRDDRYYSASDWKGKKSQDGGTLFTQFSHFIDVMYWLFGDITQIKSRFKNYKHGHNTEFEDSGVVSFEFVNGGLGQLAFSTALHRTNFESSITVIAEKGTVRVGGQYMNEVLHADIEGYTMPDLEASAPPNDYGTHKGSASNHDKVIRNVVETLNGLNNVTTNAMEGLKVVEIIERIYASAET